MKELLNSIFHTSSERIKNPLIGSYIIAALFFNWQSILIILFSDMQIEERINTIEDEYLTLYSVLWLPLLVSFFYTIAIPYVSSGVSFLIKKANNLQSKNKISEQKTILDGKLEIVQKEVEIEERRAKYKDFNNLNQTIESLNKTIDSLKKSILEKDKIIEKFANDLELSRNEYTQLELKNDSQHSKFIMKIIDFLQKIPAYILLMDIGEHFVQEIPYVIKESLNEDYETINFLINQDFVFDISTEDQPRILRLTEKGLELFWDFYGKGSV